MKAAQIYGLWSLSQEVHLVLWLGLWDIIGWSETVNYVFSLLVSLPTTGVDNYCEEFVSHVLHVITGALASDSHFNVVLGNWSATVNVEADKRSCMAVLAESTSDNPYIIYFTLCHAIASPRNNKLRLQSFSVDNTINMHSTPSTTHPTAFHNPLMHTTNKHKAYSMVGNIGSL